jgi:aspartate/methionine/tyrosine aminotransferase
MDRTDRSEERKRLLRRTLRGTAKFAGTEGRRYCELIDAYHGETGAAVHPAAAAALNQAWSELLPLRPTPEYRNGDLYDKRQPLILRELAADRLFRRLREPLAGLPGVLVRPEDVIVCPYSSTLLLEEAIATLARPGGVIVCPEGMYKSCAPHIGKFDLDIRSCPTAPGDSFVIDPDTLARCLAEERAAGRLCGVLLTLPGNPVVADYTAADMAELARVLVAAEVPVICDMSFDMLVERHIPIAAMRVPTAHGPVRMYDRVLTITGNSKGYNAFGPCKVGAACTGDAGWLARIRARLAISFQRESTHLVRAIIEHTPDRYFDANLARAARRMRQARCLIDGIAARLGPTVLRPLGSSQGMFLTLVLDEGMLAAAGVTSSAELEDLLLAGAGIDGVALDRTLSPQLGVRLNVLAPRTALGEKTDDALLDEMFDRIEQLLHELLSGLTYRDVLAGRGLPALDGTPVGR